MKEIETIKSAIKKWPSMKIIILSPLAKRKIDNQDANFLKDTGLNIRIEMSIKPDAFYLTSPSNEKT